MATADAEHISVHEAFHLLLVERLQPHAARHRLEEALLTNEVRLWVNDKDGVMVVVDVNFIASHLRVAARTEPDGRWIARIEPTRALVPAEYTWEMDRAEVEGLVGAAPHAKSKRRKGRLKAETWTGDIAEKLKLSITEDDSVLAGLIVAEMANEAAVDSTLGDPPSFDYVRTQLPLWKKLWKA
jgi:hypothetical protein